MWCGGFLLLLFGVGMESLVCPVGKQPCGPSDCFDPSIQGCNVSNATVQCVNSCNGTCYFNSQYCYNNVKICNENELVCDRRKLGFLTWIPLGLTCYSPSELSCYSDTLCDTERQCGSHCLTDYNSSCAKNQTVCHGFAYSEYYRPNNLDVCGPQEQCYDRTKSVCLNRTIVCEGLNAQLCGANCMNPDAQICVNDAVSCINSCNGNCYSNSQYCYNNTKVCNNNELVCDVQNTLSESISLGFTCYDPARTSCLNDKLCDNIDVCGLKCITHRYFSTCVKNQTICDTSPFDNSNELDVCGPQQQCFNITTSVCVNDTTVCEMSNARLCGTTCFNPFTQICANGTVQCLNSCNGICYSRFQYCYNNTFICGNHELVCDVKYLNYFSVFPRVYPEPQLWPPFGPTCYDPDIYSCYNNSLCAKGYECGMECLIDPNSICVKNQIICNVLYYWLYTSGDRYLDLCGPQQQCFDNTTSVCLNGTTLCEGLNAQLCGTNCWNSELQTCVNDTVQCLNACNGTCYSSSQYCYNNTKICNKNELVCDVTKDNYFSSRSLGLHCYNSSQLICYNGTLCSSQYLCGSQCLTESNSACAKNKTICYGFYYGSYNRNGRYLDVCGPQQKCYDNSTSVCLGNDGILCPIGSALCSGMCYNPQLQYCAGDNSTTYCLNNFSTPDCLPPEGPGD